MLPIVPFAVAAALQANAPTTPSADGSVIVWVAARPATCNLGLATKLALEAFVKQSEQWVGKCVAVTGYWYGRALFRTPSDARKRYSQSSDELDGHRVGIYGREEVLSGGPKRPKKFVAVGIANTCERLSQGGIMVMGYCHYTGGPVIAVAELRPLQ